MGRHDYEFDADAADDRTRRLHRLLRVVGVLLILAGGVLTAIGVLDFLDAFRNGGFPTHAWLAAVGAPVLTAGSACLTGHVLEFLTRGSSDARAFGDRIVDAVQDMRALPERRPDVWRNGWPDPPSRCRSCGREIADDAPRCRACGAV